MPRTPRALLLALVTTTVVITVVLFALGWMLLHQQGELDAERARSAVEDRADAVVALIRGRLAETGDRLSAWVSNPSAAPPAIEAGVVLGVEPGGTRMTPAGGLPFVPVVEPDPAAVEFSQIEATEHRDRRLGAAADGYRALTTHRDPRVRAGAFYRLTRVLRKSGEHTQALRAADDLVALGQLDSPADIRVGDVPAELAGLVARRAALVAIGDSAKALAVGEELQRGIDAGRWRLMRGDAEAYRDDVSSSPRPESWRLAGAIADAWGGADGDLPARGYRTFAGDGRSAIVLWRAAGNRTALVAAFADSFFSAEAAGSQTWRLLDAEGRLLSGPEAPSSSPVGSLVNAEYPLKVEAWADPSSVATGGSRMAVLIMLGVTLVFVWGTTYLMARAIRREGEVARLQADFVAAVSHEFRSPLTTVRQVAEMLESDRVPADGGDDRRKSYYRLLAGEAARLQRLVETLLNFGRMEAGEVSYQLDNIEASAIARSVADELAVAARSAGMRIELAGDDLGVIVRADETALATALRNLVDNAIKYSPGQSSVRVSWARDQSRIAIRVSDSGPGISPAEQRSVFQKFVRGEAASRGHVKGTGVGLSMVRQIVIAHGGDVRLESELGEGSTFTMLLPASEPSTSSERVTA